jgi:hypothetical protein
MGIGAETVAVRHSTRGTNAACVEDSVEELPDTLCECVGTLTNCSTMPTSEAKAPEEAEAEDTTDHH